MPLLFVPGRDSRHRRACFALYRALLRQGLAVPLPHDIATALGPANPIKQLIRNGFRRNRKDTSPRLVVSALNNGYRYLTLLSKAQTADSPEHKEVLQFLRENNARVLALREAAAAKAALKVTAAPNPGTIPLLRRSSFSRRDGSAIYPVYTSTLRPRPLSALPPGAVRRVPVLDEASGIPFLRLTKPQPHALGRVIRQLGMKKQEQVLKLIGLGTEDLPSAAQEDAWEELVAQLQREQRQQKNQISRRRIPQGKKKEEEEHEDGTYKASVHHAIMEILTWIKNDQRDRTARGRALWELVQKERKLAEKEARQRQAKEERDRTNGQQVHTRSHRIKE